MIPRDVKAPTIPIPFHKLLKVVAIVDEKDLQSKQLLAHIVAENFEVEVSDGFDRDVSEDAEVGAYIASIDGDRLDSARKLARAVRAAGFRTPLWALADSHRISDIAVLALTGEVDGYIYLGQQTPALMIVGCLVGMDVRICGPKSLWPSENYIKTARDLQARYGAKLTITDDPRQAVAGVDFVHTDVWVSLGEAKDVWAERIKLLKPYQVNTNLMEATGNARAKFMHCLPAFHNLETKVGQEINDQFGLTAMEVTEEVFESEVNIAFEQAESRMHTIKAILVATLGD
jgi:hypothetical protein